MGERLRDCPRVLTNEYEYDINTQASNVSHWGSYEVSLAVSAGNNYAIKLSIFPHSKSITHLYYVFLTPPKHKIAQKEAVL